MMKFVYLSFIQFDVKRDLYSNISLIENTINSVMYNKENTNHIFVLPELSNCGYLFNSFEDVNNYAEDINCGTFINELMRISSIYNIVIVAGFIEKLNSKLYNSAIIIESNSINGVYRKIHLTDYEKRFFHYGDINQKSVFTIFDNIKISVQICFDLWFPEISRMQVLYGSDILIAIANFGSNTTFEIAKIRAIENLTPLVLCNRVGRENISDTYVSYIGKSFISSYDGVIYNNVVENDFYVYTARLDLYNKKSNIICSNFLSEINIHY